MRPPVTNLLEFWLVLLEKFAILLQYSGILRQLARNIDLFLVFWIVPKYVFFYSTGAMK